MTGALLVGGVIWGLIAFPLGVVVGSRIAFREADRRLRGSIHRRRSIPWADRNGRPLRRVGR